MNLGSRASVFKIQNARKCSNIVAQYHAEVASREKKDAKFYIAKSRLNADNTNGSRQDDLQDTLLCSLSLTVVKPQP